MTRPFPEKSGTSTDLYPKFANADDFVTVN
jgi:hypothetical protein